MTGARPAPTGAILLSQTAMELRLTLRRGESLLLTLVIPLVLLGFFDAVHLEGAGIQFLVPGILALAVMSTAFTGQAIATGFERSYGVLARLGTTPLTRPLLLTAKTFGVVVVEVVQAALLVGLGLLLGWHPHGDAGSALLLLVVGTAAFSGLGLLMAGTLRAEATLAAANGIYLVLLLLGGVVFPLDRLPGWLQGIADQLPTAALSNGLRSALTAGAGFPAHDLLVLVGWTVAGIAVAARAFRWQA
ncbi:MAG: ABC transporter permease [Mycobacteriales bacterium]